MFYALATNEAEFKKKINLFVACSPVMRLGTNETKTTSSTVDKIRYGIQDWLKSEFMYEIGGKDESWEKMRDEYPDFAALVASSVAEAGSSEYNDPEREVISFSNQQPASWKQLAHYA